MSSDAFYQRLPAIATLLEATDPSKYIPVPCDWVVLVTDITRSTDAIRAGRYKEVNLLGASCIAGVLNAVCDKQGLTEVPYAFGGDGALILLPDSLLEAAVPALQSARYLAKTLFKLDLRIGAVPVATVWRAGQSIKIAKLRLSEQCHQAVFIGGGLNYATELVKRPTTAKRYSIPSVDALLKDFSGLECRWQDIPSRHGEVVSLLVRATQRSDADNSRIYKAVIQTLYDIYGSEEDFHPVATDALKLALNSRRLTPETRLRAASSRWLSQWWYLSKIQMENLLGIALMGFGVKTEALDWGQYKTLVRNASDFQKFDDTLRMVISGTPAQRMALTRYLEQQLASHQLVYGLHVSDRALITCLVRDRGGQQVHFIDGADGGYALAAVEMKAQLKHSRKPVSKFSH